MHNVCGATLPDQSVHDSLDVMTTNLPRGLPMPKRLRRWRGIGGKKATHPLNRVQGRQSDWQSSRKTNK